ncbi:OLC1v1012173C3 [Oldenlandia corymbosa var. corymbosa]|uniref:OLC1v1012173C3 n=1 Tax=Oldenlandia corymbosa var. corymbosa TaxID=529605 RepID=A0AAV1DVD7_OLDCO|nr:OLC1v1012173C3 [Oldenlandia corymbosa var. corymbosa]
MEGHRVSTSAAHKAALCDICGDVGVIEAIVTCARCKVNCEHLYCMRIVAYEYPEIWYCDDCKSINQEVVQNSVTKEEVAKESASNTSKMLDQDSTDKLPNDSVQICMDGKKQTISVTGGDASKKICVHSSDAVPWSADTFKSCETIPSKLQSPVSVHSTKDADNFHDTAGSMKTKERGNMHEDHMDMAIEELECRRSCLNKFMRETGEAKRKCCELLDENHKLKAKVKHMDQRMAELEAEIVRLKSELYGHEIDWLGVLQTDPEADEAAIKKQRFELVRSLVPDETKLADVADACKMISEGQKDGGSETEETSKDMVVLEYEVSSEEIERLGPDFSDFDKDRKKECFAAGQLWAVYDFSGMPRLHAIITRVISGSYTLLLTWLEPDPSDEEQEKWVSEGLPASCGKFKEGPPDTINEHGIFSHLVLDKISRGGSFEIYPKKGDTWALFKGWENWHSDPQEDEDFEYEFVEVLSDYEDECGVDVAYMAKLKGFACLFCRMMNDGKGSFRIPAKHIYRFSHRVPSFKMSGKERIGVPCGSFELDPASLPSEIDEIDPLTALSMF